MLNQQVEKFLWDKPPPPKGRTSAETSNLTRASRVETSDDIKQPPQPVIETLLTCVLNKKNCPGRKGVDILHSLV